MRIGPTSAGSAGMSQVATWEAGRPRVRASSRATSSATPPGGSSACRIRSQLSSSEPTGPDRASSSSAWLVSTSRSRFSIRPSVKNASTLPSGRSTSADSKGSPPSPSGGPAGSSIRRGAPVGGTITGDGSPARARVQRRDTGS